MDLAAEHRVRAAAFAFLDAVQARTGGPVRFDDVASFSVGAERIPLLDRQRGIRKPRQLDAALTFRTVYRPAGTSRPYEDEIGADGLLRYKWRGSDPHHPENEALRAAMKHGLPLVWFEGVSEGLYVPLYPVWLLFEEHGSRQFAVALDEEQRFRLLAHDASGDQDLRRRYNLRLVQQRVHQPIFRARVLTAYANSCGICRLRHPRLLDAGHIRPDTAGGEPVVTNGIALCKIHHAAFDADMIGITPDYEIRVQERILLEKDGPTLEHALQGVHGASLSRPRRRSAWPDRDLLAERFIRFREAG